jgi:uncharacterized membrane protein
VSTTPPLSRARGWAITLAAAIGLAASAVLSIEKYRLLTNPLYAPTCSVSEMVNCTQVMQSEQSTLLGFPNPYLGLVAFAVVLTIGVGTLGGAAFPRWFWRSLAVGTAAGLVLVAWLAYQSIVVIEALCPYCMAVWAVTIVLAVTVFPLWRAAPTTR